MLQKSFLVCFFPRNRLSHLVQLIGNALKGTFLQPKELENTISDDADLSGCHPCLPPVASSLVPQFGCQVTKEESCGLKEHSWIMLPVRLDTFTAPCALALSQDQRIKVQSGGPPWVIRNLFSAEKAAQTYSRASGCCTSTQHADNVLSFCS